MVFSPDTLRIGQAEAAVGALVASFYENPGDCDTYASVASVLESMGRSGDLAPITKVHAISTTAHTCGLPSRVEPT